VRPYTGSGPSVCLRTRRRVPGVVAQRSLTSKEAGYRFWLNSPLGLVLGAREGVSEEGGRW
jgi:hypothetical protein